jgi:hypothetical protein
VTHGVTMHGSPTSRHGCQLTLRIWRQPGPQAAGAFFQYRPSFALT